MEEILQYISPELMIVIPVLYFVGMALKRITKINDALIPFILGGVGIVVCGLYEVGTLGFCFEAIFAAVVQGVLTAGMSVYLNNLIKQGKEVVKK